MLTNSLLKHKIPSKDFIQLFEDHVNAEPHGTAVVDKDDQINYEDLNARSNKLAHYLMSTGVKKGDLIGLCTSLNINFIVCMLGILKSGATYFPLDPTYPIDRLQFMLWDGKPSVILTEVKYADLFDINSSNIIQIDELLDCIFNDDFRVNNIKQELTAPLIEPEDLAYVIYTSGSTGNPKGIMITHKSLPNVALAHNAYYPSNMRMLISGGVCFDANLLVIFHALSNNKTLYLFNSVCKENTELLMGFIESNSINYMICVPSQYLRILQNGRELSTLKCVCVTGDNLPKSLCDLHAKLAPNALLYNEYGPSECAIGTTIAKIYDPKDQIIQHITVGKPLPNTLVYVLDDNLNILSTGARGEICIAGIGLARGYLNNEVLTGEKFVWITLPTGNLIRLYRTGDIGRFLPNGDLEFLGRTEQRACICGKWIDLGEIEQHISQCTCISESVLLVEKNSEGENQIVAYISSPNTSAKEILINYLCTLLPKPMIPNSVIQVDKFPLSPNGKIDRDALVHQYA